MPVRAIILLALIVASLPVCFVRPFFGVLLWTVLAFVNPQSYTWSGFDAFPWAAAVAVPTVAGMLAFERRLDRLASPQFYALVVLWLWFTLTTIISTHSLEMAHHAADTRDKWVFVSKIILMAVCAIPLTCSLERLRYLVLAIAASFGFFVMKSVPFLITTGGAVRLYGPEKSMIADNNDLGLALNMTLPLYFCLAQTETKPVMKGVMALLFVMTIPAIFFTYSRGALVGLSVVTFLMFMQSKRRLALIPVMVIGLLIALFFAPEAWKERMNLSSPEVVDASAQARLHAWAFARALASDYPIAGGGFATFTPELYDRYSEVSLDQTYGPHSVYFQVLAEHGYIGLSLYLVLVLSCFVTLRRLRRAALSRGDAVVAIYSLMFQLSLIGFLFSGIFLGRAYFDYYFSIVACVAIMSRVSRDRWREERVVTAPLADVDNARALSQALPTTESPSTFPLRSSSPRTDRP